MSDRLYCPICDIQIAPERQFSDLVVCECGWSEQLDSYQNETQRQSHTVKWLILSAGVVILGLSHWLHWGEYSLEAIPLKISQVTGTIETSDLYRIAEICKIQKNIDCVEESYTEIYNKDPRNNAEALVKLGILQTNAKNFKTAASTFKIYFEQNNGQDFKAAYYYALALGKIGNIDEATTYYQLILNSKPGVLQTTAAKSFVHMLMDHNELVKAKSVIAYFRSLGENTDFFMNYELKKIDRQLASN